MIARVIAFSNTFNIELLFIESNQNLSRRAVYNF